jgi:hypothetical protein
MNKASCEVYSGLKKSLREQQFFHTIPETSELRSRAKSLYEKIKEGLEIFNRKIKNCKFAAFLWIPNDICLSGSSCYKRIKSKWRSLSTQIIGMSYQREKIDCPCIGNHTYSCALGYCTFNKKTCDLFHYINQKISEANIAKLGIKICHNDFLMLN